MQIAGKRSPERVRIAYSSWSSLSEMVAYLRKNLYDAAVMVSEI